VRELGLPKDLAEILESRFCEKTWSAQGRHTIGTDIEKRKSFLIFFKKALLYIATTFPEFVHRLGLSDMTLVHGGCSSMPLTEV
jgi:hypothetical protein